MLQYAAVCCSMLQYVAVCCNMLQYFEVCCSMLQYVAVCCSMLQSEVLENVYLHLLAHVRLSTLVAACCSVLQRVAVFRSETLLMSTDKFCPTYN